MSNGQRACFSFLSFAPQTTPRLAAGNMSGVDSANDSSVALLSPQLSARSFPFVSSTPSAPPLRTLVMPLRWLSQRGLVFVQAAAAGVLEGRTQQRVPLKEQTQGREGEAQYTLRPCLYPTLPSEEAADAIVARPASAEEARRATEAWEAIVAAAASAGEARVALSRSDRSGSPLLQLLRDTELQLVMHHLRFLDLLRLVRCNRRLRTLGLLPFGWKHTHMAWQLRVAEEAAVASSIQALMALSERMLKSACATAGVDLQLQCDYNRAASRPLIEKVLDTARNADVRVLRWVGAISSEGWTALLASPLLRTLAFMFLTPSSECDASALRSLSLCSSLHTLDLHLCNFPPSERSRCLQPLAALPALTDLRWTECGAYRGESQVAFIRDCAALKRLKLHSVFLSVRCAAEMRMPLGTSATCS